MNTAFFYEGVQRLDFLGNPNKTAALIAMAMVAVWALPFVFRRGGFWVALCLFIPLGICLMHTFSRGGVVAALSGLGVMLACYCNGVRLAAARRASCRERGPRRIGELHDSEFQRTGEAEDVQRTCASCKSTLGVRRRDARRYFIAVSLAALVISFSAVFLQAHQRFTQGTEDHSIRNRLVIWKEASAMMRDAPSGWGFGNSGKAFMEWYQPLDSLETYRTLVNSHLTWLVEMGWMGRFLYVSAWLLVLMLCLPMRNKAPWMSVCLGIWIAFFMAAIFSSVAECVWLWVLPVCALIAAIVARIKEFRIQSSVVSRNNVAARWFWNATLRFARLREDAQPYHADASLEAQSKIQNLKSKILLPLCLSLVGAAVVLAIFVACAHDSSVRKGKGYVVYNSSADEIAWWVLPDTRVTGSMPGRVLRGSNEMHEIAIAESFDTLPHKLDGMKLAVAGKATLELVDKDLSRLKSLVLLNPEIATEEIVSLPINVKIYIGEYSSHQRMDAIIVKGASVFLSDWPALLP